MALKDYNNLLVTKHKDMELYVLYNKEFKIAVLRKLSYKKLTDNSVKSRKQYIIKMKNLTKR